MANYINEIHVVNCWAFKNKRFKFDGKRHLIFLGPNGSGKTSILDGLASELVTDGPSHHWIVSLIKANKAVEEIGKNNRRDLALVTTRERELNNQKELAEKNSVVVPYFNESPPLAKTRYLLPTFHFKAARIFNGNPVAGPMLNSGVMSPMGESNSFVQYLVNRRSEQAYAREEGNNEAADNIAKWFSILEQQISNLAGEPLTVKFNRKSNFAFSLVHADGRESPFESLPAGYGNVLEIFSKVLMHFDKAGVAIDDPNTACILLLDEPEVHLHPRLQLSVLPALAKLIPGAQIIAATHSPMVAASLEDAIVYNLETGLPVKTYGLDPNAALLKIFDAELQPKDVRELIQKVADKIDENPDSAQQSLQELEQILGSDHEEIVRFTTLLSLLNIKDDDTNQ
ncbi:MAG: ATP-binding protein [Deltaproteobacteria bacterium]|nr:ATP-binding protein [Deltaproteobacteria bacterium]